MESSMRRRASFLDVFILMFPVFATWIIAIFLVASFLLEVFMGG